MQKVMLSALAASTLAVNAEALTNLNASSHCTITSSNAQCTYKTEVIQTRDVHYMIPSGTAPAKGWPVAMMFHGWNTGGKGAWSSDSSNAIYYNKIKVKAALVEAGYAVFTPDSSQWRNGGYWQTNVDPYANGKLASWEGSDDHMFLAAMFGQMGEGSMFGKVDMSNIHIMGFSSGGYQSSRMALSASIFKKSWKSVSIQSGGPAWCSGMFCSQAVFDESAVATAMKSHAPTLFLHGSKDYTVPSKFAQQYEEKLKALGKSTKFVAAAVGHQWLSNANTEILAWVKKYTS